MSLKKAATSGAFWTFLDVFIGRGIGIVAAVVLARMLSPREFGLMGMIYIFTGIANSLVDSGMSSSLIRDKNAGYLDFTTVFYTNLFFALLIYLILFLGAPYIAIFYQEQALKIIVRVYGLLVIINAFSAVQIAILTRSMNFKNLMILNLPGILIGAIVGISLAFHGWQVWSLIYMHLLTQTIYSLLLWMRSEWKPSLYFSKKSLYTHFSFGYKLMLSGLLNTVFDNLYNVLIGKFFSVTSLGYFERARKFNLYPVTILTSIIGKVTYPLLSEIQGERERLGSIYRQLLQFIFFTVAPVMILLSIVAKPLFLLLLGEQWNEAGEMFAILCLSASLYPLHIFNLNLLKVEGRSDLFLRLEIIKKVITLAVVLVSFSFGIKGLVWGMVVTSVLALMVNTYYTNQLIKYSLSNQLYDMRYTIIALFMMYIGSKQLTFVLTDFTLWFQIVLPLLFGIFVFVGVNIVVKNPSIQLITQTFGN